MQPFRLRAAEFRNMTTFYRRSLLLRAGLAMAGITLLALVSMGTSVIIAERLKGQAAAMNQAGSLRMQSFAITTRLLSEEGFADMNYGQSVSQAVQEFEERLLHPRLARVLGDDPDDPLFAGYDQITREWRGDIRPLLSVYLYNVEPAPNRSPVGHDDIHALRRLLVARIHAYVERVDRFVSQLEAAAESKIAWLRLILGIALLLTLALVTLTMRRVRSDVVRPLRDLLRAAERARGGDFSARVRHTGENELGRLGHAFNVMAEDLSKVYADLESRVRDKTADLERRNRSLELLYHTITQLTSQQVSDAAYTVLLKRIEGVLGLGPSAICLTEGGQDGGLRLATTARVDQSDPFLCSQAACAACLDSNEAQLREPAPGRRLFSAPLRDQEQIHGMLQIIIPADHELDLWQEQIIETIALHIGIALGTRQRVTQGRRLALFEERTVIARELHDSLAQSLSYLKIQVSRLQAQLAPGGGASQAILDELREGINNAYRQLRELLTTFRLKMDGRGLAPALEATVQEFRVRAADGGSAPEFSLDNRLGSCPLNVNEEIHVLQVVREALSNVARHARATHAAIALRYEHGTAFVTIDDDGIGYTPAAGDEPHHYGLVIMQERARSLGGDVRISQRNEGGTRVELRFTPAELRRPSATGT